MKRKTGRKLLSFLLTLAMVFSTMTGIVPGMSLTALAEGTTYNPASAYTDYAALNTNNTVVTIDEVANVEWYVIGYDSEAKTVTLLSKTSFGNKAFNSNRDNGNNYANSEIKTFVEGLTGDGQPLAGIKNALADIRVTGDPSISGAVPYLLSTTEANNALDDTKKGSDTSWWLRSPVNNDARFAACVYYGVVYDHGRAVSNKYAVRPALQLNLESVIFDSESNTFTVGSATVDVTGVTLNPSAAQTIDVDGTVSFTATVAPDNATDKKVKWSVGGTNTDAVTLYSDEACETAVTLDTATETLTVYAKGISAGSATVTATSNADSEMEASCAVTVNAPAPADTYVVAGSEGGIFDSVWSGTSEANKMTLAADGTYTKSYEVSQAYSDVQLKVVKNGQVWIGDQNGNNVTFNLTGAGTFTVAYNPNTGAVSVSGEIVAGESAATYYASYVNTTTVTFNDMDWYIIADDSTAVDAGTVTLLAKDPIGASKFHDSSNAYSSSTVKTYLDSLTATGGSFEAVADAITPVTLTIYKYESTTEVAETIQNAKLWLLSTSEAQNLPENIRKCSQATGARYNYWWLRSAGYAVSYAACVNGGRGRVSDDGNNVSLVFGVRPALKLNLESVIFSSESGSYSFELKPSHAHSFTYAADGATVTATCGAEGCDLTSNPTLTIVAPTLTTYGQTGEGISEKATLDGLDAFNSATDLTVAASDIKYYGVEEYEIEGHTYKKQGDELAQVPTAAGEYVAGLTLSNVKTSETETGDVIARVWYTIAPASISSVTVTDITAPVATEALDTEAATSTANVTLGAVTWNPTTTPAAYATQYTATVIATAAANYAFADTATATVNGQAATVTKNDGGTLTIAYTFEKTALTPVTITATDKKADWSADGIAIPVEGMFTITEGAGAATYTVTNGTGEGTYDAQTGKLTVTKCGTFTVKVSTAATDTYAAGAETTATLTVNKVDSTAATVTANTLTYTGSAQALVTVTGEATGGTMQYALGTATEATEPYTTSIPTATNAGTYYVWYKVIGDSNHSDSTPDCVIVSLAKKTATVKADAKSKIFGKDNPALTATVTGAVGTDSINYTLSRAEGENVGEYTIIVTLGENPNYDVTATNGTFTITKATITGVTATTVTATYDGQAHGITVNGAPEGTTVTFGTSEDAVTQTASPTFVNAADEAYKVYYKVSGANYEDLTGSVTVKINRRPVVVSGINANDKDYDEKTDAALDYTYVNFENIVDTDKGKLTVTATGAFEDETIGKGKTVNITGITLGGDAASNYVLAATGQQATAIADISEMKDETSVPSNFVAKVKDFTGQDKQPAVTGLDLTLATSLCTPAELAAYGTGAKLELSLEISKAGALMTPEVVEQVTNALKNEKNVNLDGAAYYDVSLYKKVGAGPAEKVTDLNGSPITVTFDVPEDMHNHVWENRRTYYVVRIHAGVAQVIAETTDLSVTFSTDKFSVYALCYADKRVVFYDNNNASTTTAQATVVAPKTSGTDETARTLLVFGTAFAVAAIVSRIYVFGRRKEEEE